MKQRVMTAACHSVERTDCEHGAKEIREDVSEGLQTRNPYRASGTLLPCTVVQLIQIMKRHLSHLEAFAMAARFAGS